MTETQFGLFQGPENVKTQDKKIEETTALKQELESQLMRRPYEPFELRMKILRGFLGLHFKIDPNDILDRPLECLGGKTLGSLCLSAEGYALAYAWTQEYRLHQDEKEWLIRTYRREE